MPAVFAWQAWRPQPVMEPVPRGETDSVFRALGLLNNLAAVDAAAAAPGLHAAFNVCAAFPLPSRRCQSTVSFCWQVIMKHPHDRERIHVALDLIHRLCKTQANADAVMSMERIPGDFEDRISTRRLIQELNSRRPQLGLPPIEHGKERAPFYSKKHLPLPP